MTNLSVLASLAAVWAIVVLSPGPCFLVTVSHAASRPRAGVFVALGVETGTLIWCSTSLLGLGVVFSTTPWLYDAVRLLGAGYLLFLGIAAARRGLGATSSTIDDRLAEPSGWERHAWQAGFLADISNPKAAVFFGAMFASLLPPSSPLWLTLCAVVVVVVVEFGWYCSVSYLFRSRRVRAAYHRSEHVLDGLMAVSFAVLAVRLLVA